MRVIVCGGRSYYEKEIIFDALNEIGPTEIAHGGAPGADRIAHHYATERRIPVRQYPADWHKHGNAAGPIRNQQMLDEFKPDLVVAFPGGRGTASMVRLARAAGVKTVECGPGESVEVTP